MKEQNKDLIIKQDGKITKYKCHKKIKKNGNAGGIILPKELIGKIVYVELKK